MSSWPSGPCPWISGESAELNYLVVYCGVGQYKVGSCSSDRVAGTLVPGP